MRTKGIRALIRRLAVAWQALLIVQNNGDVSPTTKHMERISQMADIHILDMAIDKKTVNCIFHIPIPETGVNGADIQWRDAVVLFLGGSGNIATELPSITSEEDTLLKSGGLIEQKVTVRFSSLNITDGTRLQEVKNSFSALKTSVLADKQIELAFIGLTATAE